MINRNSFPYRAGKFCGRVALLVVGYLIGRKIGQKPIDKFPKKK